MKIDAAMIHRFFARQCTDEEAVLVSEYLKQFPEVLERYMSIREWDEEEEVPLPDEETFVLLWKQIEQQKKRGRIVRIWAGRIAAAVVLFLAFLFSYYALQPHKYHSQDADRTGSQQEKLWTSYSNGEQQPQEVRLPDSSLVTLYPSSAITYNRQNFNTNRTLSLSGAAVFDVKASKTRPFTVYSKGVYTTALGTRFRITAYDSLNYMRVNLYRGKVHIAVGQRAAEKPGSYHMVAGDVFYFDANTGLAKLSAGGYPEKKHQDQVPSKERVLSNWYAFENRDMAEVLNQLAAIYNVKILYDPAIVKGLSFIGRVEKQAPLDRILNDIALVNGLNVTKKNGDYIISRK